MRATLAGLIGLVFLLTACGKTAGLQSKQAVRQAIEAHLKKNSHLSLQNFTTVIEKVTFKADTAEALVRYQSKQSSDVGVLVRYELKKAGDHWEVTSSSPVGGQGMDSHTGMTAPTPQTGPLPNQNQVTPESSH